MKLKSKPQFLRVDRATEESQVHATRKTQKSTASNEDDDYPLSYLILTVGSIVVLVVGAAVVLYVYFP